MTLTQGHGCDIDKQKFACLQDKVRTTQPITTKLGSDIPLAVLITWLDFGEILLETLFFAKFSLKISDVFFLGQTLYWTYLRNGWSDWCETKRRCIGWMLGEPCDLDLWPHPWPWPCSYKVKVTPVWGDFMFSVRFRRRVRVRRRRRRNDFCFSRQNRFS